MVPPLPEDVEPPAVSLVAVDAWPELVPSMVDETLPCDAPNLLRLQMDHIDAAYNPDLGLPSVLEAPMRRIDAEGRGVLVHICQPGGGERGGDTFKRHLSSQLEDAPEPPPKGESERLRDYGIGAQILADLGVRRMRLLTNRPRRIVGLEGFDLSVEETVKLNPEPATVHRLKPKA